MTDEQSNNPRKWNYLANSEHTGIPKSVAKSIFRSRSNEKSPGQNKPLGMVPETKHYHGKAVAGATIDCRDPVTYERNELMDMKIEDLVEMVLKLAERTKTAEKFSKSLPQPHLGSLLIPGRPKRSFESSEGSEGSELCLIGWGGFSNVHSKISRIDKKKYAVKTLPIYDALGSADVREKAIIIKQEIKILSMLPYHSYLVAYLGTDLLYSDEKEETGTISLKYLIKMEYCAGGDLVDHLSPNGPVRDMQGRSERLVTSLRLFQHCVEGLRILHQSKIWHRDIKPANIFLYQDQENNLCAKLGDFGLSCEFREVPRVGYSPYFSPPEQQNNESNQDQSSDIFSLGMVLCALVLDNPDGCVLETQLISFDDPEYSWDFQGAGSFAVNLKKNIFDLILRMTSFKRTLRPSIKEVKRALDGIIYCARDPRNNANEQCGDSGDSEDTGSEDSDDYDE